ncbi:RHS repeat-associated core domain-containing protein [Pseudomonas sp. CCOS 191]|uniref:RHS repeat-associated core domain-containing protein n=1 Tax=Pseudomonas sp. CCOS 191 TaxID=1649877 RepID=UPI001E63341D|nr:RHS repeat-associated core domain-containing protein [Pseudomonas sp. CCOS 191]
MAIYLLACDRQNSPIDGVGFPGRSYTAYGEVPSPIGPMTGFCGQSRDARMDRYPLGNGHRRYNPVLMRFHEPDALSPFGKGGINVYAYCGADPINRNDPTGRIPGAVMLVASAIQHTLGVTWTWRTWPQGGKLAVASALSKKAGHALLMTALTLKAAGAPGAQEFTLAGVVALGTASALKHRELTLKNRENGTVVAQSQGLDSRVPLMATLPVNGQPDGLEQVVTERPPGQLSPPSDMNQRVYNMREADGVQVV